VSAVTPRCLSSIAVVAAQSPSVFDAHGRQASELAPLGWAVVIISCVVIVVTTALLLVAIARRRSKDIHYVERTGRGLTWVYVGGIAVPVVVLTAVLIFTMTTLSAASRPATRPALDVEVIAHQWWWEVRYHGGTPAQTFLTANEIHLPVGQPVRLSLVGGDVIHSFWVPQLAGKTDVIPGQVNQMWIQADRAGTYRGMCAEYCGLQHAHMDFVVVAQSPEEFRTWEQGQLQPASPPHDPAAQVGFAVFQRSACMACHAIRGTEMLGRVGPDLTHLASRQTLAAGVLPNTRGNLAGWVSNAQAIKPGTIMPTMPMRADSLEALVAYLETLK
jgi:cytochrome c oxidase subunit 2